MKSLPNSFFKDYATKGMVYVGSAKRLNAYYATETYDHVLSASFTKGYLEQHIFWFEFYNKIYNLYLFDNQKDILNFAEEGDCPYICTNLFFEEDDTAVVFNQTQFAHIMMYCKGDVSKDEIKEDAPIIWHQNMPRGFYELTFVEAHAGLGICLELVTDAEKLEMYSSGMLTVLMPHEAKY